MITLFPPQILEQLEPVVTYPREGTANMLTLIKKQLKRLMRLIRKLLAQVASDVDRLVREESKSVAGLNKVGEIDENRRNRY